MSVELSPLAKSIKPLLVKTGRSPGLLAEKLGRTTAKGTGPALATLVAAGLAVKNADGTYSKPLK